MRLDPTENAQLLSRKPPRPLTQREACVGLHTPNVLRVPSDSIAEDPTRWFNQKLTYGSGASAKATDGNEVTYLIDGHQTFQAMVDAIETAHSHDHFILIAGWFLGVDFEMVPGDSNTKLIALLTDANDMDRGRKVRIRALLWKMPFTDQNRLAAAAINALPYGRAILDTRHLHSQRQAEVIDEVIEKGPLGPPREFSPITLDAAELFGTGSHHQKILVVNGSDGLIAFCGGVDINPDRIDAAQTGHNVGKGVTEGSPLHDVHCRLRGPAAHMLLRTFFERWKDHPANAEFYYGTTGFESISDQLPQPSREQDLQMRQFNEKFWVPNPDTWSPTVPYAGPGGHHVQIGRTYGNGFEKKHGGIYKSLDDPKPYAFAERGETTAQQAILHAIGQARKFIYVEDQYFSPMEETIQALSSALDRIQHLTLLIPYDSVTAMGMDIMQLKAYLPEHIVGERHLVSNQAGQRRCGALKRLAANHPGKVRAFYLSPISTSHTYVHTKMWIMDDECAVIGSANCNRRSYNHDSEVVAAIADQVPADGFGYNLAHRLRIALWAEHLFGIGVHGVAPPEGSKDRRAVFAELADGVASAVHWLKPPPGARITRYDENRKVDTSGTNLIWNAFVDADGS